jgi:hypothetical protein
MSIVEPERPSIRKFLTIICPCGRSLRAPIDKAGQEISCWECHRMVRVPVPHSSERAFRIITDALPEVYHPGWLLALFVYTALVTGVLCVPGRGPLYGALVLILGAIGYGEVIRQCGIDTWDFDDWKRPGQILQRLGAASLLGVSLAAPLLLAPGGPGNPPRFSTLGFLAGLFGSMVLPVLMFLAFARDEDGPLGWRRAGTVLWHYPVATSLALALIPLGVIAAEFFFVFVSCYLGSFRFLLLELFPGSQKFAEEYGIPIYGNYTRPMFPDMRFVHLYWRRVHQGFSFTGGLPGSLAGRPNILLSVWTMELMDADYLRIKVLYCQFTNMVLLFFLALQSRWLGVLSTLESKRVLESSS